MAARGDRYALDGAGRVLRYDAGADERALAGSSFARWLDATVAREQVLYGPDGEYAPDVFDPSGEEVTPLVALRQAERALKQDPGAAGAAHARGLALRRLGRAEAAVDALAEATALDPDNPWPWFDLGRAALDDGAARAGGGGLSRAAAELEPGPDGGAPPGLGRARRRATASRGGRLARRGARARRRRWSSRSGARRRRRPPTRTIRSAEAEAAALLAAIAPRRERAVRPPAAAGRSARVGQRIGCSATATSSPAVVLAPQHRRDPAGPGGDREASPASPRPARARTARRRRRASSA